MYSARCPINCSVVPHFKHFRLNIPYNQYLKIPFLKCSLHVQKGEDTKVVIRSRKAKRVTKYHGQMKNSFFHLIYGLILWYHGLHDTCIHVLFQPIIDAIFFNHNYHGTIGPRHIYSRISNCLKI